MSQAERWQLGGNAPEVYETQLVPAVFGPWAPVLVAQAALRAGERALDDEEVARLEGYAKGFHRALMKKAL